MIKIQSANYRVERLTRSHDISTFSSGVRSIDNYLHKYARQDLTRNIATTFVALDLEKNIVRGYYTLASCGVCLTSLPEGVRKKLPKYEQIPAILLGRLGVDKTYREIVAPKARLGELLLLDAQKRALRVVDDIGSALLVVDVLKLSPEESAVTKDPLQFYLQYGFMSFSEHPRKLFKPMQTIKQELLDLY